MPSAICIAYLVPVVVELGHGEGLGVGGEIGDQDQGGARVPEGGDAGHGGVAGGWIENGEGGVAGGRQKVGSEGAGGVVGRIYRVSFVGHGGCLSRDRKMPNTGVVECPHGDKF